MRSRSAPRRRVDRVTRNGPAGKDNRTLRGGKPPELTLTIRKGWTVSTPGEGVVLEVFQHLFAALAEERGAALRRSAFSPNIKERRDYSCALFDPAGDLVAMGDHMPVHLGAMPMSVRAALEDLGELDEGDVAIVNNPFRGGTHLPDITAIRAVRGDSGRLLGYVATRAHHADVGGSTPGSMPLAREIYEEGLRIPPVRLYRRGVRDQDLWRLILANVRTPEERAGDLDAQLSALHAGRSRLLELVERHGSDAVLSAMAGLIAYADRLVAAGISRIPDGQYVAEDALEDDGFGNGPVPIHALLTVTGDHLIVDFEGSSPQVPGGINAVAAITASATRYVVRCVVEALLGEPLPAGGGSMAGVELRMPDGSVVNARPPASVAAGNVETSQRITDVLLMAFARALPDLIPALSQGTMNNITVGGPDSGTAAPSSHSFAYYETVGGGMGAGPSGPGLSGVHVHMSNSLNTPIEALEHTYPFRVAQYSIRRGSGGAGLNRGGEGLRRDLLLLAPARVTLLSERRARGPAGLSGGGAGAPGENVLIRDGVESPLPGKVTFEARPGDVVSMRTPGGGGWGEERSTWS
ncbi:MAG: hydantoinase B/oxoprolinase family protein [Gemmatimonadetes bacterium]|nr:hydantoinase B/oxoprolinase family protein [Gemmatimonadota bacterium]